MKSTITVKVLLMDSFREPQEWVLEVPREMRPERIADFVFVISNAPPEFLSETQREILAKYPRTGLRSVSVGDMLIIGETDMPHRHIATVGRVGFKFH